MEGGKPFTGILPKPPSTTGSYQNQGGGGRGGGGMMGEAPQPPREFYADSAVVAFRLPETERRLVSAQPKVTSSGGDFKFADLVDGDLSSRPFSHRLL